jgi:methionine-gamma-lyase
MSSDSRRARPVVPPIYATSTFLFESAAQLEAFNRGTGEGYIYARDGNPTVEAVEATIAALEGAEAALLTASGMAACTTSLLGLLSAGDELVCSTTIYGGTLQFVTKYLPRFGIVVRFVSLDDLRDLARVFSERTRVVWFESPTNPTLRCVDLRRVAEACRARGVLSIVDGTFASPINQRPVAHGIDLVMHSATKYLNGHSDLVAGALAGSEALVARLRAARRLFGAVLDPMPAHALARGLKTLALRVARQNASAQAVAEWLARDPRISRVDYPGLASHPDHEVARRQMSGFGGMVTFECAGGYEAACRAFDRFRLILRAASLGGTETLCSLPVLTSHYAFTEVQLRAAGVTRGMIRLSVGLDEVDDILADLDQAL